MKNLVSDGYRLLGVCFMLGKIIVWQISWDSIGQNGEGVNNFV